MAQQAWSLEGIIAMQIMSKPFVMVLLGAVAVLPSSRSLAETVLPSQGYATPFTVNEYIKTDGQCARPPKQRCTQVKVSYPSFQTSSQSSTAIHAINTEVQRFLLQPIADDRPAPNIEAAMVRFLQNYQKAMREFPRQGVWADEKQVDVISNRPNLLSLRYAHYWYTGGAHPNSSQTYWNFNPQTGQQIQLSDVLVKGYAARLNALAEKHFRQVRELEADASLNQLGFWFENDQFQVNTNFAIAPKGLTFFFNTYEIGPYVIGPTELQIPYSELEGLIKNRALLPKP